MQTKTFNYAAFLLNTAFSHPNNTRFNMGPVLGNPLLTQPAQIMKRWISKELKCTVVVVVTAAAVLCWWHLPLPNQTAALYKYFRYNTVLPSTVSLGYR
jgi:hypothetical protein